MLPFLFVRGRVPTPHDFYLIFMPLLPFAEYVDYRACMGF